MPEKDPATYSFLTYLWVIFLAGWGGVVNFLRKLKSGEVRAFNFTELVGEIVTSAFTGIITFFLCQNAGMHDLLTAALVGISGHMGSRALFRLEQMLRSRFE